MAEISFKSVGTKSSDQKFRSDINVPPIGFKTPLRLGDSRDEIFDMHLDIGDQIHDNFKNLLLTNHGERIGLYDFGANLRALTTERQSSKDDFDSEVMRRVKNSCTKYMPFIELQTFESTFEDPPTESSIAKIYIKIIYTVSALRIKNRAVEVTLYCIG